MLQLFLDLSNDPLATLERLPEGEGPLLTVTTSSGQVVTKKCPSPAKLSEYWSNLYKCASLLECCENFLSACSPSAPCLLCHPFGKPASLPTIPTCTCLFKCLIRPLAEKLAQTLEIKDQDDGEFVQTPLPLNISTPSESLAPVHTHTVDSLTHHVEVQVLESGQVAMSSAAATAVTFDPTTESTAPVVAKDTLSSLPRTAQVEAPPPVSSSQLRRVLSGGRRRQQSVGTSSARPGPDGQVEVDGQFDMPIPDSTSSGVTTTCHSPVMTFVTTSVGLTQTVSADEEEQQHLLCSESSLPQQATPTSSSSSGTQSQAAALPLPVRGRKEMKSSIDAATQTMNSKMRSEAHDRTPLIIRRSRIGKSQKLQTAVQHVTHQKQQPALAGVEPDAATPVESNTRNGNATGTPSHQEVEVQTQTPPDEMESTPAQVHVTTTTANEQGSPLTPRRSKRKTAHRESPKSEQTAAAKPSSPVRRSSPRKSSTPHPLDTPTATPPPLPRIRTRSAAKRHALEEQVESRNTPPAKRTRRSVQERSSNDGERHPQSWGVEEVTEYINSIQSDCTNVFRDHVRIKTCPYNHVGLPTYQRTCVLFVGGGR